MLLLMMLMVFGGESTATNPKPISPTNHLIKGDAVLFRGNGWKVSIKPVSQSEFMAWVKSQGIKPHIFKDPRVQEQFGKLLHFQMDFRNTGEDSFVINPEQILLRNKGFLASQVSMSDFPATGFSHGDPDMAALAQLFVKESFEVPNGRTVRLMLSFNPMLRKFPRKVSLVMERLFYGIESQKLECVYDVRTRK